MPSKQAEEKAREIKLYTTWNGKDGDLRTWDDVRKDIATAMDDVQMQEQHRGEYEVAKARNAALEEVLRLHPCKEKRANRGMANECSCGYGMVNRKCIRALKEATDAD